MKKLLVFIRIENGPDYCAFLGQDVVCCPTARSKKFSPSWKSPW